MDIANSLGVEARAMNRANQRLSERTTNIQTSIRSTVSQPIFLWLFAQTRADREDRRKYLRRTCWPNGNRFCISSPNEIGHAYIHIIQSLSN